MKVDILGHEYEIIFLENAELPDDSGKISFMTNKLLINNSYPVDIQQETLVHEIVEAINWWGDLQLYHHQVSVLSTFFWGVIKDNPEIKEFIWDENKSLQ